MPTPKMTRAHFQFIADTIKAMPTHAVSLRRVRSDCANTFAEALAHTNPLFDREKFLVACGLTTAE